MAAPLDIKQPRAFLSPDDASSASVDPHRSRVSSLDFSDGHHLHPLTAMRRKKRNRERDRTRKGQWKKLLWVKQSYPDNYTDEETFLDHLQRNPRMQPYDFWPLVFDSLVIVQQICTMLIFICCFYVIIQERVSPVTVVSWASAGTVLGWILWDIWVGQEEAMKAVVEMDESVKDVPARPDLHLATHDLRSPTKSPAPSPVRSPIKSPVKPPPEPIIGRATIGLGLSHSVPASPGGTQSTADAKRSEQHSRTASGSTSSLSRSSTLPIPGAETTSHAYYAPLSAPSSPLSPRVQQRLATLKSALLIYVALLGLSPILKSLTKSTASDSIWAMAFWLMCINVIFFDYSSGVSPKNKALANEGGGSAKFPASLSTNAALMASTVLASRLPSTMHVFSLTLFSIEVFGLFPIFRRYLRQFSSGGHLLLTWFLVVGAGGGVAVCMGDPAPYWPYKRFIIGAISGCILTGLAMGMCSWWLIGLQRYKNEIHGPWDPARPIIRRRWD